MAFVSRDIGVNEFGRFQMVSGPDNIFQKVEKFFRVRLSAFIGQKANVPVGTILGALRLVDIAKSDYTIVQDRALNRDFYDTDDIVTDIDQIEMSVQTNGNVDFKFRILTPSGAIEIAGTIIT